MHVNLMYSAFSEKEQAIWKGEGSICEDGLKIALNRIQYIGNSVLVSCSESYVPKLTIYCG